MVYALWHSVTIKNSDWNQRNIDQVNCPGIGGERHRGLAGELEILVEKAREGLLTSSEGQRDKHIPGLSRGVEVVAFSTSSHIWGSMLVVSIETCYRNSLGRTEREMVEWYHWLNGHESEQTLRDSEGQGRLACCSSWGSQKVGHNRATEQQQ